MTSLAYGVAVPYEVQLYHLAAVSTTHMTILVDQRSPGQPDTQHLLTPGVYMVSLAYNGSDEATLEHVGGGATNRVSVPGGTRGVPRTSAPMKISVHGTAEYLRVAAPSSTGLNARAAISVIPAATFDEMAESAQGVSVLSDISNLKTALDARVPADMSLRLDTSVGTRVFAGDTMIYGDTGLREITETGYEGWLGTPYIQRLGNAVYVSYIVSDHLRPDPDASVVNHPFLVLPVGFRAARNSTNGLGFLNNGYSTNPAFVYGTTALSTTRREPLMFGTLSWVTPDPWPTTLPGLPA